MGGDVLIGATARERLQHIDFARSQACDVRGLLAAPAEARRFKHSGDRFSAEGAAPRFIAQRERCRFRRERVTPAPRLSQRLIGVGSCKQPTYSGKIRPPTSAVKA